MAQTEQPPILEARQLTKAFGRVIANRGVSLAVRHGEIVALLGENGAGKSTIVNMLYGMTSPDSGELLIDGVQTVLKSPRDALARGIGMVHQHFMLIPPFTVAENVALGNEPTHRGRIDLRVVEERISALATRFAIEVNPRAQIRDLSVGQQQRVEIVKALYRGARVLILDEPTAVLTPQESDALFSVLRGLASGGTGIIFISHKLGEVLALSHRIVVMRRGEVVGETIPAKSSPESLAALMVGREVLLRVSRTPATPGSPTVSVRDLVVTDDRGGRAVDGVGFSVRAGEIVGIAGVQGNGQTELVEALTGLRPIVSGQIFLDEREVGRTSVRTRTDAGLAHVPEDRRRHGVIMPFTIGQNLILNRYQHQPFSRWLVMRAQAMAVEARGLIRRFDIRPSVAERPVSALSGGNVQKVIVAREMARPVRAIVAAQPTRGVDVGSIEFIHRQLIAVRDAGTAVLLVSAELDELLALADRILVMFRGRVVGELSSVEATRERLGLLMAGVSGPVGQ